MEKDELEEWFVNVSHRKLNDKLICIYESHGSGKLKLVNIPYCNIVYGETIGNFSGLNNNYIVIVTPQNIVDIKKFLHQGVIIISDSQSVNNFEQALLSKKLTKFSGIKYDLLESNPFENILALSKDELFTFINERKYVLEKLFMSIEGFSSFYFKKYFDNKILFTELAIKLYELTTLKFCQNNTSIGLEISKILGTSSKTINLASLSSPNQKLVGYKKAYDLNIRENKINEEVRLNVATKLLKLKIKQLNVTKIAKIVELPLTVVENIYAKLLLK